MAQFASNDAKRASEIAAKYEDKAGAVCFDWLSKALNAKVEILDEESAGLLSTFEKARLLRLFIDNHKKEFQLFCGPLAVDIMMAIGDRLN